MLSILVPYRPDGGYRDRSWRWLHKRWLSVFPGCELILATDDGGENPSVFNHPRAINRAAEQAKGETLLIADCDTAFNRGWVERAYYLVAGGDAPWVMPRFYDQLTKTASEVVLNCPPDLDIGDNYKTEWQGDSVSWAGLVMVPTAAFHTVGGYDERFVRWGGDDVCFGVSLDTLWGKHQRIEGSAMHLWHPRDHLDAQPQEQHDLMHRYLAAEGDEEAISALRGEDREWRETEAAA